MVSWGELSGREPEPAEVLGDLAERERASSAPGAEGPPASSALSLRASSWPSVACFQSPQQPPGSCRLEEVRRASSGDLLVKNGTQVSGPNSIHSHPLTAEHTSMTMPAAHGTQQSAAVSVTVGERATARKGRFEIRDLPPGKDGGGAGTPGGSQAGQVLSVAEMRVQNTETGEIDHIIHAGKLLPSPPWTSMRSGSVDTVAYMELDLGEKALDAHNGRMSDGEDSTEGQPQIPAPVSNVPSLKDMNGVGNGVGNGIGRSLSLPGGKSQQQDLISLLMYQNQVILERLAAIETATTVQPSQQVQQQQQQQQQSQLPQHVQMQAQVLNREGLGAGVMTGPPVSKQPPPLPRHTMNMARQNPASGTVSPGAAADGTGRRGEGARFNTLMDQLRDEVELANSRRRDTELELKVVREKNKSLEERLKTEQARSAGLETKLERSKARNRVLQEDFNAALALLPAGALANRASSKTPEPGLAAAELTNVSPPRASLAGVKAKSPSDNNNLIAGMWGPNGPPVVPVDSVSFSPSRRRSGSGASNGPQLSPREVLSEPLPLVRRASANGGYTPVGSPQPPVNVNFQQPQQQQQQQSQQQQQQSQQPQHRRSHSATANNGAGGHERSQCMNGPTSTVFASAPPGGIGRSAVQAAIMNAYNNPPQHSGSWNAL